MNVKRLKEILSDLPDNYEVILSSDSEGNNYRNLVFISYDTWDGDDLSLFIEEEKENCVVLWP